MVKISFQSVAGQKVEKESDGDKTEILIPHPMVSSCETPGSVVAAHLRMCDAAECRPSCTAGLAEATRTCTAMNSGGARGGMREGGY